MNMKDGLWVKVGLSQSICFNTTSLTRQEELSCFPKHWYHKDGNGLLIMKWIMFKLLIIMGMNTEISCRKSSVRNVVLLRKEGENSSEDVNCCLEV